MAHPKLEMWRSWCAGPIRADLLMVNARRHIFGELARITEARGDLPRSQVWPYLRETYATTQALAIRRQGRTSRRALTLARLLRGVAKDPSRLKRRLYVKSYGPGEEALANERFDERFAGARRMHIDPSIVESDLKLIDVYCSRLKKYVNDHLPSHRGESTAGLSPLDELDFAIDGVGQLFEKYSDALMGPARPSITPQSDPTLLDVFLLPWMPSVSSGLFTSTVARAGASAESTRSEPRRTRSELTSTPSEPTSTPSEP